MIPDGTIMRRIALLSRAVAAVRAGAEVDVDTVIARRRLPGSSFSVAVAGPLRRRASDAKDAILVRPGARLLSNQPIARAGKHEVRSPDDAIYLGYSVSAGIAHLAVAGPAEQFLSHVRGQVAEVEADAVTVRLSGARVVGIGGSGAAVHGPLLIGVSGPGDELRPSAIDAQAEGRIVVGGAWASAETLTRARAIGVTGLILGGIHARALAEMDASLSRRRALGAGQAEFGILVLEGYGRVGIEPTLFTWLVAQAGKMACLAGSEGELLVLDAPPAPRRSNPAAVGDRVIGTRRPTLGLTGVLVSLLPDLHAPSSGIPAVAGMVRLDDGRLMPIPLANLETVNPA